MTLRHRFRLTALAFVVVMTNRSSGADPVGEAAPVEPWRALRSPETERKWVNSICFSPDGSLLASASQDYSIRVWSTASGRLLRTLRGPAEPANSVAFSPDGKCLASVGEKGSILLWDAATGKILRALEGNDDPAESVAFSPDGKLLATTSRDRSIRLWDPVTGKLVRRLEGHDGPVACVSFAPNGKLLAAASTDTVSLWDPATGKRVLSLMMHQDHVNGVCFSPDGKLLATACEDGTARLWDSANGDLVRQMVGKGGASHGICFSPDSKLLATDSDCGAELWETCSGQHIATLPAADGDSVIAVCFSPGGRLLASGGHPNTVLLWNMVALDLAPPRVAEGLPNGLWGDLGSDARRGYRAINLLVRHPDLAVPWLEKHVRPTSPPPPRLIARLLNQLDDASFPERERAKAELAQLGDAAGPALRKALHLRTLTPEQEKRVQSLLRRMGRPSTERLRALRLTRALELVGNPQAVALLKKLAEGAAGTPLTEESAAALARLGKRARCSDH